MLKLLTHVNFGATLGVLAWIADQVLTRVVP